MRGAQDIASASILSEFFFFCEKTAFFSSKGFSLAKKSERRMSRVQER